MDFESESITRLVASDGNTLSLEQEWSLLQQPNLGLERLAVSAGAIYLTQELEGPAALELALDGLVQTGTGEAMLSVITGTSAGGYGTEPAPASRATPREPRPPRAGPQQARPSPARPRSRRAWVARARRARCHAWPARAAARRWP